MKPTVCIDLDGVLAIYDRWRGIEHIGDPIEGAVEFTRQLSEFASIVIFTTRCKEYPGNASAPPNAQDVDRLPLEHLVVIVRHWLDKHGFVYDDIYTGQGKPFYHAMIDDRAVTCRPQQNGPTDFAAALDQARHLIQATKHGEVSPIIQQTLTQEEPPS